MKKGWDLYASQKRIKQKGYLRKHRHRGESRKTRETSGCDSLIRSQKEQEEIKSLVPPEPPLCLMEIMEEEVKWYKQICGLNPELLGESNESMRDGDAERPGRNGSSCASIMDLPDVSRKPVKRGRKAKHIKKSSEGH